MPQENKNTEEIILEYLLKEYKTAKQIMDDLNIPRRRTFVHLFKLRKNREIVRVLNEEQSQGRIGFKYRTAWHIRNSKRYRNQNSV